MSVSELHEQADAPSAVAKKSEAKRSYPKTHANHWKSWPEHRTYTHDGTFAFFCASECLECSPVRMVLWEKLFLSMQDWRIQILAVIRVPCTALHQVNRYRMAQCRGACCMKSG